MLCYSWWPLMSLILQLYAQQLEHSYTSKLYGDIDNFRFFIHLSIIFFFFFFYKIHMGVISLALKGASIPFSPLNSPHCDCQDESQLSSMKHKQLLKATFSSLGHL